MKKTLDIVRGRWRELLLDIFVIIMGILLAFGLNNWNDNRKDQFEEQELLMVLEQEFKGNKVEVERILSSHHGNIERLSKTLDLLDHQDATTGSEDLIQAIKMAVYGNTYNPMFGVMNSILNSDKINLIQNEELKYSLARFPGIIDDYIEEEELILKVVFDIILPEVFKLNPEATVIKNLVLQSAMQQMILNLQITIAEGENLILEMTRIKDIINGEIRR